MPPYVAPADLIPGSLFTILLLSDIPNSLIKAASGRGDLRQVRRLDVSENAVHWRFVWLAWLPIYLLVYWLPRWV